MKTALEVLKEHGTYVNGVDHIQEWQAIEAMQAYASQQAPIQAKEINTQMPVTDKDIEAHVTKIMKADPVKFASYAMLVIGKDIHKANAGEFTLNIEADLEEGKRFRIDFTATITAIQQAEQLKEKEA